MNNNQKNVFYRTARIICCLFCFLLVQSAVASPEKINVLHPQGLLWKVTKQGQADSYLFGTIHISDSRVQKLISVVQKALKASELFAMEVVLDTNAQETITNASFFGADELLQDYVDDIALDSINRIMQQYYGIPAAVVNRMKPWAVMATISSPPPESNKTVLDIELQNLAIEYAHPVVGLETIGEQVEALSGMEMSDQLWMLNKALNDFEQTTNMWEQLIKNYINRDLEALVKEQNELMDDSTDIDDRFMEKLVDKRNIKMAERMMAIMKNKSVFVAIGALHLPGKKGVLHLLEKAGYQVKAIY